MRNILALLALAALLSGCASGGLPEPDPSYVPDITIEALSDKMVAAVDPNGTYRKSTSYFMKQDIAMTDGKTLTMEVTFKIPDKSSSVVYLDGKPVQRTACNGNQAWIYRDNQKAEVVGKDFERIKLFDAISSPTGTILDAFAKVEFAGEAQVEGAPCYILYCHPKAKDLEPLIRYVSKTDFLTRKLITLKDGKPYLASIRKYALVKGVMIATETEMDINDDGKPELMTVTDYRLNVDPPDSLFE